ncbi:MAG: UvrD-helicase domain-containing protein [Bacteroidota bacterium]
MKLTKEQKAIIKAEGNIKINAVAGSGKTTTIIEYARAKPKTARILYLAFNKSVKLEAIRKFRTQGLRNVSVETAHSLAYRHIIRNSAYQIRPQPYKTHEIAEMLNISSNGEKMGEYILANHINKFLSYYCNSNKSKPEEINYSDVVKDPKAKGFVNTYHSLIVQNAKILLNKMDKAEIEVTHDFYLKKFQLASPELPYDYILFDEGQDASPAMLDVFFRQKATKVIVGDSHQQIYGWRFAVNSLEKAAFTTLTLSNSFRFNQNIARLAQEILKRKAHLNTDSACEINGQGSSEQGKTRAVIARTNLGLLLNAIDHVRNENNNGKIYFEGNINSYTYASDGASLYDVLNLHENKHRNIRDKLIKRMRDTTELREYVEKTEDAELAMMLQIVEEYGSEIPSIIKNIKAKHIDGDDKNTADMIFSTVHRCKGSEYDDVRLVNDFISEEKLKKIKSEQKKEVINHQQLIEEINLLYVAVTRTKNTIHIPESLMPVDFPATEQIHITEKAENELPEMPEAEKLFSITNYDETEKAYNVEEIRKQHKAAYRSWTSELDEELTCKYRQGTKVKELANYFGRTEGSIRSRIKKLQLKEA